MHLSLLVRFEVTPSSACVNAYQCEFKQSTMFKKLQPLFADPPFELVNMWKNCWNIFLYICVLQTILLVLLGPYSVKYSMYDVYNVFGDFF